MEGPVSTALSDFRLSNVPASMNGMALGLCGLAGLWSKFELIEDQDFDGVITGIYILSCLLYCVYMPIKLVFCFKVVWKELHQPPVVAAVAAMPMATMLLGVQCYVRVSDSVGFGIVVLGGLLQFLTMMHFFRLIWVKQIKPETYWFPPTVSIAVTATAGCAVGWAPWAYLGCFYAALAIMALTLPFVAFRGACQPTSVSLGPSFNMLCAPASLNSLVWHQIGRPHGTPLGLALWILSTVFWMQTFLGLYQRRKTWTSVSFSPAWAALTFPLASSCQAALYAYEEWFSSYWTFKAYVWGVVWFCNVVLVYTHANYYRHLPIWLSGHESMASWRGNPSLSESDLESSFTRPLSSNDAVLTETCSSSNVDHGSQASAMDLETPSLKPCRARSHSISVGPLLARRLPVTEQRARELLLLALEKPLAGFAPMMMPLAVEQLDCLFPASVHGMEAHDSDEDVSSSLGSEVCGEHSGC